MSIKSYKFRLLRKVDFSTIYDIPSILSILKTWRKKVIYADQCNTCCQELCFKSINFQVCCNVFYFTTRERYIVKSLAIDTGDIHFLPVCLHTQLQKHHAFIQQQFLVLPDPIYWQLPTTLVYETVLNFVLAPNLDENNFTIPKKHYNRGSFHQKYRFLDEKLMKYYQQIQNSPLYHCSLSHRTQGKDTLYRKITIPKRAERMARGMIIPATHLKSNEIAVPRKLVEAIPEISGKIVIINRLPSLSPENFVGMYVAEAWNKDCFGISGESWKHLHCDFDGDECNLLIPRENEPQIELKYLLNSKKNMKSFKNYIKLYPPQDMIIAFYLDRPPHIPPDLSLFDFLCLVFDFEGSKSCFEWFNLFRLHYLDVLQNKCLFAITIEEFDWLRLVAQATSSFEEFEEALHFIPHKEGCLETQVRSGSKGTFFHLYQLVGSVGLQPNEFGSQEYENISSSFMDGLTPEEYIVHAKSGQEALIKSTIEVWVPGYNYSKMVTSTQNIVVDYKGRLVDGDQIISDDALAETYFKDLITDKSFKYLFDLHFK